MMGATVMSSFSDAHECPEIPIIAANLHRVMQPRQSQIWAVIRETDPLKRIGWSVAATLLGRMCISGDVTNLSKEQWKVIDDGIAFYNAVAPIIRDGETVWFGEPSPSYRHTTGWQGILRSTETENFCVYHRFNDASTEDMTVQVPDGFEIVSVYTVHGDVTLAGNELTWHCGEDMSACAVHLKKKA